MSSIGMHPAPFGLPLSPHPAALGHSSHGGSAKCLGLRLPRPLSPATTSLQRAPSNHDQEAEASLQPPLRAPACRPRACQPLAHTAGAQGRPASRASPPQLACRPLSEEPCAAGQLLDARAARPTGPAGWGAWSGGRAAPGPDDGSGKARRQAAVRAERLGVARSRSSDRCSGWGQGSLPDRCSRRVAATAVWPTDPNTCCRQPSAHAPAVAHVRRQRMRSTLAPSALQPWFCSNAAAVNAVAGGCSTEQHGSQPSRPWLPECPPATPRSPSSTRAPLRGSLASLPAPLLPRLLQERRPQQARPRPRQARALRVVRRHGAPLGADGAR